MPAWVLVRAQGRKVLHLIAGQRGDEPGQGKGAMRRGADERLGE